MKDLLSWLIVIIGSLGLLLYVGSKYNESAADKWYAKGQARSMIIEAQGQARLDTAIALMPYVVIGLVAVFGGAILILAVVILRQNQTARIERIETRILILPQGSKRQLYEMLSKANEIKLLKD